MSQQIRGASGIEVERPESARLDALGVKSWPIWEKEPSAFDWHYDDREVCYLLAGEVVVSTPEGDVSFGAGDVVTFPQGLSCTWHVKSAVRKHYRFG